MTTMSYEYKYIERKVESTGVLALPCTSLYCSTKVPWKFQKRLFLAVLRPVLIVRKKRQQKSGFRSLSSVYRPYRNETDRRKWFHFRRTTRIPFFRRKWTSLPSENNFRRKWRFFDESEFLQVPVLMVLLCSLGLRRMHEWIHSIAIAQHQINSLDYERLFKSFLVLRVMLQLVS